MHASEQFKNSVSPDMHLEDVEMEIQTLLTDIHNGVIAWWSDDIHDEVQGAALDLMFAMNRLRNTASSSRPQSDPGPSQEQRL